MAKARSRAAARKVKDRWKAKNWYNIIAPPAFDSVTIADTMTDNPEYLINRVTGISLQDLTNDFRKSHIILFFKINKVEEDKAHTQFSGHTLTSDYLRRMIRRRRSKIEGVYDVDTRDGAKIRVKPFATTDKRIQNSQRKVVREAMKTTISNRAKHSTLSEFMKNILDGRMGSDIYKNCKKLYPVKRIEIHKTEVISHPTIVIEEKKPKKEEIEEPKKPEKKEKKPKDDKKTKEVKEPETKEKEIPKDEKKIETPKVEKKKAKKTPKPKKEKKKAAAKKPVTKKTAIKKTIKPKTTSKKKTTTKKKATKKK